uniref:Low affinity cationic amino acid transporter 2 n=2 Tax=Aceria tosichella TaxID=561515 RepID=A0A6G1S8A2_9ACAR
MGRLRRFVWALTRRKPMDVSDEAPTDLDRCLNTLDLTAMGVGATLGFGLYVLSGEVAALKAGPGVVLSFMIAAIASTSSALCYAEFAAKVPKSGSAYAYSYITVGEFVAFVIGWNLTLEHVIGTASLARGYSGYLGSLFAEVPSELATSQHLNGTQHIAAAASWVPEFMQGYVTHFDWLAFMLTMLVTGLLLLGVQVSSKFQITFASINLSVACFIFVCGLFKADLHNWQLTKEEIPATAGEGGFLPFGWTGVIAGAGTCFFAFVGFDGIAATAEEVKNPRKAIPNSILWTSAIIFITYSCMATIQTLIWPYWDQKQAAPLPYIFEKLGMHFAKWTILVGVLAGLSTSFVGGFLPLPRILYAMARDGVIYRLLAIVSKRFKVPYVATILGGILIACLASMLEIDQLADMLSIGTLAAYSLVSISVLLLRYEYRKPTSCENPLPLTLQEAEANLAKIKTMTNRRSENLQLAAATHNRLLSLAELAKKESSTATQKSGERNTSLEQTTTTDDLSRRPTQEGESLSERTSDKKPSKHANNEADDVDDDNGVNRPMDRDERGDLNSTLTCSSSRSSKSTASSRSSSKSSSSSSSSSSSGSSRQGPNQSVSCSSEDNDDEDDGPMSSLSSLSSTSSRSLLALFVEGTKKGPNKSDIRRPDEQTTHISRVIILMLVLVTTLLDFALVFWGPTLGELEIIPVGATILLILATITLGFLLNRLPRAEPTANSFEVPLVPTIPLFSVIINTYLMLNLSVMTWIRFAVWMTIGFFIYFTYGIFKSTGYKDSRCD